MFSGKRLTPTDRKTLLWLMLIALLIFGIVLSRQIASASADYQNHIRFAVNLVERGEIASPHILYQLGIILLGRVLPFGYVIAAMLITLFSYLFSVWLIYRVIRPSLMGQHAAFRTAGLALALMIAMPINLFTLSQFDLYHLYHGYISFNAFQNPTTLLVKPLSLLIFLFCLAALNGLVTFHVRTALLGVALTLLGIWAKPNYLLCLLPSLLIILSYRLLRRTPANGRLLILAVFVPAVGSLLIQYALTFQAGDSASGITISPFTSLNNYEPSTVLLLLVKLPASILFPAAVYAAYFRQARTSLALNLSWLTFGFGLAQFYLLAETGERALHGNWWWGAQIALWILFIMSAAFLTAQVPSRKRLICWIIFAAHVFCGIVYLIMGIVQPEWTT